VPPSQVLDELLRYQLSPQPSPCQVIDQMLEHADASGRVNFQTFKKTVLSGAKNTKTSPNEVVQKVTTSTEKK
jgi:hypothetical protein